MRCNLPRGLIVSCQAAEGEPLYGCNIMHLFARCAAAGGAVAIRALGEDIKVIKKEVSLPVVGLIKARYPDSPIYITPTKNEIDFLLCQGCEVIALDATLRRRPGGETLESLVAFIRSRNKNIEIMADVSDMREALNAERLGFDYISTTLRGYTEETKNVRLPDFDFIRECCGTIGAKVVAEGGIWERGQLEEILQSNPYAVVIGTAITRPMNITARFNECFKGAVRPDLTD